MLLRGRPRLSAAPLHGAVPCRLPAVKADRPTRASTTSTRRSGTSATTSRSSCTTPSQRCRQDAQKKEKEKEALAQVRRSSANQVGGLGVLRSSSVTTRCQRAYQQIFNEFLRWLGPVGDLLCYAASVDIKTAEYLEELYLDGEGLAYAQRVVAAVLFFVPVLGKGARGQLPRAVQALKGFRRLDPPKARLPFPWEVVAMLANGLVLRGLAPMALALLLMFELYLRPGETFGILTGGLVPPVRRQGGRSQYDIVLFPFEEQQPSKTQEFDHALSLDLTRHAELGPALDAMVTKRSGSGWRQPAQREGAQKEKLFNFAQAELLKKIKQISKELGAEVGVVHLYRVRHAGASHDFVTKERSLEEVRRRGRWRTHQSVRRYEKGARTGQLLHHLSAGVRTHALACGDSVYEVIAGKRSALREDSLLGSSSSSTPGPHTSAKRPRGSGTRA